MATDWGSAGQVRNARERQEPMEKNNTSCSTCTRVIAGPMKNDLGKVISDAEKRFHSGTAEPGPSASTEEIKMKDVYRKCCSCHMMKAFTDGRDIHRVYSKPQWCCFSCNSLQKRIACIQDSARAILGWYDVRQRIRDRGSSTPGWTHVRKTERARFMERAAGLTKDDLRNAMLDAVRHLRKQRKNWVDRRRRNVKRRGDKKLHDKVHRETPMSKLTHMQNERLVYVQGKLQGTSVLLHASIREASKHKGTKVPTNTLDKAKAVAAEIVKLVKMASDIHATGKRPRGMLPSFFQDAKRAIDVANEVSAKMSSLLAD